MRFTYLDALLILAAVVLGGVLLRIGIRLGRKLERAEQELARARIAKLGLELARQHQTYQPSPVADDVRLS